MSSASWIRSAAVFSSPSTAQVDAFHEAATAAGGKDNGPPGIRAHYHENYYGAFVHDADGNNIEALYRDVGNPGHVAQ
mgnify:CR=1 FL=1